MEPDKKKSRKKETYLKIYNHILNIEGIDLKEKVLLAHIYSFGAKGCWQSNATLAKIFMTTPGTISRWIANLKQYVYVKSPKGYYRALLAKSHPDVRDSVKLYYKGRRIEAPEHLRKNEEHPTQKCGTPYAKMRNTLRKNAEHPTQKCVSDCSKNAIRLTQKCATTNNITKKETIQKTIASPSPLACMGQASATLAARRDSCRENLEQFKQRFGTKQRWRPLNVQETMDRVQRQRKALEGLKKADAIRGGL